MELSERILRHAGETQDGLVKGSLLPLGLRIQAIGPDRVTGRPEAWDNLFAGNIELFALNNYRINLSRRRRS